MDAYDLGQKVTKYWAALYPKNSGELPKPKQKIRVVVNTEEGLREVVGIHIVGDHIQLELDKE